MTSRGRQFDRLALMFLGDIEVFRTSTAEPTTNGIIYTYVKEMSQYIVLWKKPQKVIFDLGNLIDDTYTGIFNVTLMVSFSKEGNVRMADMILPISARQSSRNASSAFLVPSDNAAIALIIPSATSRAVVSISACGQLEEEFWWSNVLSQDTTTFQNTVGELYGSSPFREIQLFIDDTLAGVIWPFPIIFTGGVAPGFWRPMVGIDAFDLREPEIDISPFLPLLTDGFAHSFQIKIAALDTISSRVTLADSLGSFWVVTGKIFLYLDENHAYSLNKPPKVIAPQPTLTITRAIVQSPRTGANESLSYSVEVERFLNITSSHYSWCQNLTFSNHGLLNEYGFSQRNAQHTLGELSASRIGPDERSVQNITTFKYPLDVNTTYSVSSSNHGFTISALINRGLGIYSSGALGISTYTLAYGNSDLQVKQWGKAYYSSITGGGSYSSGDTSEVFEETSRGSTYKRYVKAVNGTVIKDTKYGERLNRSLHLGWHSSPNRAGVKSILGRGPR